MGTTGKVPSSSVKAHWVGSIPTGPTKSWHQIPVGVLT